MDQRYLDEFSHNHDFIVHHKDGEKRTLQVLILTAITMIIEITAGSYYGSMALLADGWHMATHVAAFMITLFAYRYARRNADNPAYAFGTGKVSVLGGFASAIALAIVAIMMISESLHRLFSPQSISFNEAILVAIVGLMVNIISAFLLMDHHDHHHDHEHNHHHHDHNLRAAYMHVIADAFTSVLAIIALLSGKYFNWHWMDPVMGLVGAVIIIRWAMGLVKTTGPILLDESIDQAYKHSICKTIESDTDNKVFDCHIWKVGPDHYAAIIAILTRQPRPPQYYKDLLTEYNKLAHITIEVNEYSADNKQS